MDFLFESAIEETDTGEFFIQIPIICAELSSFPMDSDVSFRIAGRKLIIEPIVDVD